MESDRIAEKIPYTSRPTAEVDDATEFIMPDAPVPEGFWLFIQHFACRDLDNNCDKIIIGRGREKEVTQLFEEQSPATGAILYHSERDHFCPENENPLAIFEGAKEGDHVEAYIDGYLTPKTLSDKVPTIKKPAAPPTG